MSSQDILDTLKCGRPEYSEETRNYETIITKNERLAIKEITRLRKENARLREALKPFAGILKGNYSHQSDDMPIKAGANQYDLVFVFTLGDLRAAAAAIREGGKDEN